MIEQLPPPPATNYAIGRRGNPVTLIIEHWMDGSFDSALARFRDPTSVVSAHYLVGTDGRVAQLVQDEDTAYHSGDFDVNLLSIGIEHEASPTVLPSDALYAASRWLHALLSTRHSLPLELGVTVKPHRAIVPTACPGTLDLARLIGGPMTEAEVRALLAAFGLTDENKVPSIIKQLGELAHHGHGEPTPPVQP